ncbi:MAG: twin-arginine translocation signal domain-containing protein [Halapricum sp.]
MTDPRSSRRRFVYGATTAAALALAGWLFERWRR